MRAALFIAGCEGFAGRGGQCRSGGSGELLGHVQGTRVGLLEHVVTDVPDIDADPERIGQVLGNLLDNALRHTPPGGQVSVTLDPDPAGIRITIADDGEGIAAAHLPHLFERFYRADPARDRGRGGSGIGLTIVRTLVHAHGGRVTADSDGPGTGATFTVTLHAAGIGPASLGDRTPAA